MARRFEWTFISAVALVMLVGCGQSVGGSGFDQFQVADEGVGKSKGVDSANLDIDDIIANNVLDNPKDVGQDPLGDFSEVELVQKIKAAFEEMLSLRTNTPDEQQFEFATKQAVVLDLTTRLFNQAENSQLRMFAATMKLEALKYGSDADLAQRTADSLAFTESLLEDEDPDLQQFARDYRFTRELAKFSKDAGASAVEFAEKAKAYLAASSITESTLKISLSALQLLSERAEPQVRIEAIRAMADMWKRSDHPAAEMQIAMLSEMVDYVEAGFADKLQAFADGDASLANEVAELALKLGSRPESGINATQNTLLAAEVLSERGEFEQAEKLYQFTIEQAEAITPAQARELIIAEAQAGLTRVNLIGEELKLTGNLYDGTEFDPTSIDNKVVLVHFWSTSGAQSLGHVSEMLEQYKDQGFAVVGVNLDTSEADENLKRLYLFQAPPFPTIFSTAPESRGRNMPLAKANGIRQPTYSLLLGTEGRVISLNPTGVILEEQLAELFAPGEQPASEVEPAKPEAAADATSLVPFGGPTYFVALLDEEADSTEEAVKSEAGTEEEGEVIPPVRLKRPEDDLDLTDDVDPLRGLTPEEIEAARKEIQEKLLKANPYLASADLKGFELIEFIFDMQDRPKIIQRRPGFTDALVEAADRVLTNEKASDRYQVVAADAKFNGLHRDASFGDQAADKQLMEFVKEMKGDERKKIKAQVEFFELERTVIDAAGMPEEEIPALLTELKTYFAEETLEERHLRMASSTVAAINRLKDGKVREEHFKEFGELFTKSDNKELKYYGMKLAMPKDATKANDLVGKELELSGETVSGDEFDWKKYRGKVVLVDFWATWCGPCLREMPKVKGLYEDYNEKGFEVVGISIDKDEDALFDFIEQNEIEWETLKGEGAQDLATKYGVRAIPTMMLIDREGKVVGVANGVGAFAEPLAKLLELDGKADAKEADDNSEGEESAESEAESSGE